MLNSDLSSLSEMAAISSSLVVNEREVVVDAVVLDDKDADEDGISA